MDIHQWIRERRAELNLSMEALGKLVGVSYQTIQQWEKDGGTAPKRGRWKKVIEVLGAPPSGVVQGAIGMPDEALGERLMLSPDDQEWLHLINGLTPAQKAVFKQCFAALGTQKEGKPVVRKFEVGIPSKKASSKKIGR